MHVRRLDDPAEFLDLASPLLLADEARHNVMFGIATTLRDYPARYPEFGLWLARDGSEPVAAALRTPPRQLVLAKPRREAALHALVAAIDDELPGLVGHQPEADQFAAAWAQSRGATWDVARRQRLFALDHVDPPAPVPGAMRDATHADRPLAIAWWRAFGMEAIGETDPDEADLERGVDHRLDATGEGIVLWEDGRPVSLAGFGSQTPDGVRIGPVYTPPERRGRGYASALVAQLSERLLRTRRFCFLYTDLANPTANRIYERIGYRRVCDGAEITFSKPR